MSHTLLGFLSVMIAAVRAIAPPLSDMNPVKDLGFASVVREASAGAAPSSLWAPQQARALPTNSWFESFALGSGVGVENNAFVMPYIVQTERTTLDIMLPWAFMSGTDQFMDGFDSTVEKLQLSAVGLTSTSASVIKCVRLPCPPPTGFRHCWHSRFLLLVGFV